MKGLLLAVTVENITTRKDHTVKLTLGTQELSQGHAGELFNMMNKLAAIYLSPKDAIDQKEIDQVDAVDPEFGGKSQSQRIRNVLFVLFEANAEGHKTFDDFYKTKTEEFINSIKNKLP